MEGKRNSVMNKRHISSVLVLFLLIRIQWGHFSDPNASDPPNTYCRS